MRLPEEHVQLDETESGKLELVFSDELQDILNLEEGTEVEIRTVEHEETDVGLEVDPQIGELTEEQRGRLHEIAEEQN